MQFSPVFLTTSFLNNETVSLFGTGPVQMPDGSEEIGEDVLLRELFLPFRVLCTRKDVGFLNFLVFSCLFSLLMMFYV